MTNNVEIKEILEMIDFLFQGDKHTECVVLGTSITNSRRCLENFYIFKV